VLAEGLTYKLDPVDDVPCTTADPSNRHVKGTGAREVPAPVTADRPENSTRMGIVEGVTRCANGAELIDEIPRSAMDSDKNLVRMASVGRNRLVGRIACGPQGLPVCTLER
jgi:hypothetical protein